jgi:hypothetical protein
LRENSIFLVSSCSKRQVHLPDFLSS